MNGQWIGDYAGTSSGLIMINIDDRGDYFEGHIYLNDKDGRLPGFAAFIHLPEKPTVFELTLSRNQFWAINRLTGEAILWEDLLKAYPDNQLPNSIVVNGDWSETSFNLSWVTNLNGLGSCKLKRNLAEAPSKLKAKIKNWASFKQYVSKLDSRKYIFRGQRSNWRLVTGFHRTGRANLFRFLNEDIQTLHKNLSARTRHIFNLSIPNENGAFFNLVQHHGYPTPLLDWSYSPFVSAFFAYRRINSKMASEAKKSQHVRIFVFNKEQWERDFRQLQVLAVSYPHFSLSEFIAIDNERMIPQQGISTVTNVSDVESYVARNEKETGKTYLQAIDLPWTERDKVVHDLTMMGITAGSLFPGLDGMCEEIKERLFT
jgi:hypothetical protein